MGKKIKRGVSAIMAGACLVMSLPTCITAPVMSSASYLENTMNHISPHGLVEMGSSSGLVYYIYNKDLQGDVSYCEDENNCSFVWDGVNDSSFYLGKEFSYVKDYDKFDELAFTYKAELNFNGNDSFGIFFDMGDPNVECHIIEGWGNEKPCSCEDCLGVFTSNGVTYEIYKTERVVDENTVIDQYWSVSKASITFVGDTSNAESTVDIKEHIDAWKKAGLATGGIKDIYFNVNAGDSSGDANLSYFYIDDFYEYDYVEEEEESKDAYPAPWEKEIDDENIRGYIDGFDYMIHKETNPLDPSSYEYKNNSDNGFNVNSYGMADFDIYKGRTFKKPVSADNINELSVDYDLTFDAQGGDKFDFGIACAVNNENDYIYIVDSYSNYDITKGLYKAYEYEVDGVVYGLYQKPLNTGYMSRSFWCIPETKLFNVSMEGDCSHSVDIKPHLDAIMDAGYWMPEICGCYFYVNTTFFDSCIDLHSLSLNYDISSDLSGLDVKRTDDYFYDEDQDYYMLGDLNEDNRVDSFDLIRYRRLLLESGDRKELPRRADIDEDGNIKINDMVLLKKYVLGKSKKLGVSDKFDAYEDDDYYFSSVLERSKGKFIDERKDEGLFTCAVKDAKKATYEYGRKLNHTISVSDRNGIFSIYDAEIETNSDYVFGLHGRFNDSDNEFYIVESGRYEDLLKNAESLGSFTSDSYIYDVYRVPKGKPFANGRYMCYEYWSVLRNYSDNDYAKLKISGNINILDHISAYEELGDDALSALGIDRAGLFIKCRDSGLSYIDVTDNRIIEN